MCEIVLGGGMTEVGGDATDTVIFAHPSLVLQAVLLIPVVVVVALVIPNLGGSMMITLPSLYQIHRTPSLAQMSSQ